jgi:mycothiol system anti-sigma-R factor
MRHLDCEDVLREVWSYLDGEVEETRFLEIQAHVEECAGCGPRYEFQRRLIMIIQTRARQGYPAPEILRQRLFRLLEE